MTRKEQIKNASYNHIPLEVFYADEGVYLSENEREVSRQGFERGAKWADRNPKSPWIKWSDKKPKEGIEVIGYNPKWIDEDFNPNGTRIGFMNGDLEFTSAYWWDYQDSYLTINKSTCNEDPNFYNKHIDNTEPMYWMPIPKLEED